MPIREPTDDAIIAAYVAAQLTKDLGSKVTLTAVRKPSSYRGPAFEVKAEGDRKVQQKLEDVVADYTSDKSVKELGMNSKSMGHFTRGFDPITIELDQLTSLRLETVQAIKDKDAPGWETAKKAASLTP